MPYFLGAVDDNYVARMGELRRLRQELRRIERKMEEYNAMRGEGVTVAQQLLSEATDIGLRPVHTLLKTWDDCIKALLQLNSSTSDPEEELTTPDGNEFLR